MAQNYPNREPRDPDSADRPPRHRNDVERVAEQQRPAPEGVTDSEEIEQEEPADTNPRAGGGQGFAQGRGANPGQVAPELNPNTQGSQDQRERRSNRADAGLAEGQDRPEGTKQGSDQQDPPPTLPLGAPHEERDTM